MTGSTSPSGDSTIYSSTSPAGNSPAARNHIYNITSCIKHNWHRHAGLHIFVTLSIILMVAGNTYFISLGTLPRKSQKNEKAEEYYDPALVLKNPKIPLGTSQKNLELKNFNQCGDYRSQMSTAGFNTSSIFYGLPEPHVQSTVENTRVLGTSSIALAALDCFWILNFLSASNFNYVLFQKNTYTIPPIRSERRILLTLINGPENPAKPGFDSVYKAARYEIKGYTAFIVIEYDSIVGKHICALNFSPYVVIGATGDNCDQVKQLAAQILP